MQVCRLRYSLTPGEAIGEDLVEDGVLYPLGDDADRGRLRVVDGLLTVQDAPPRASIALKRPGGRTLVLRPDLHGGEGRAAVPAEESLAVAEVRTTVDKAPAVVDAYVDDVFLHHNIQPERHVRAGNRPDCLTFPSELWEQPGHSAAPEALGRRTDPAEVPSTPTVCPAG